MIDFPRLWWAVGGRLSDGGSQLRSQLRHDGLRQLLLDCNTSSVLRSKTDDHTVNPSTALISLTLGRNCLPERRKRPSITVSTPGRVGLPLPRNWNAEVRATTLSPEQAQKSSKTFDKAINFAPHDSVGQSRDTF